MVNERVLVALTTVVVCAVVAWGFDVDGRYLQQIGLICAGLVMGELLTRGGKE